MQQEIYFKELINVKRVRYGVYCKNCNTEIKITNDNSFGDGYSCFKCSNILLFQYRKQLTDIEEILKLKWNIKSLERCLLINEKRGFVHVNTKKDIMVLKLLQYLAKIEEASFMMFRKNDLKAGLYIDLENNKYIGFLVWSKVTAELRINQIFVLPEYRRNGLGTELIKYWVNNYAKKLGNVFGVETPNNKTTNLLVKVGYYKNSNKTEAEMTCYPFMGM